MQAKIKSDDNCESLDQESDSLALTKVIKGIAYKFESQHNLYPPLIMQNAFYTPSNRLERNKRKLC